MSEGTGARLSPLRGGVTVLAAGVAAGAAMLAVGRVFNAIESSIPSIPAEYEHGPGFRTWPGWTAGYMLAHPLWFGFVFAGGFVAVARGRLPRSRAVAARRGALYGAFLFVAGSLPVFALVYASFRVSPELVAVSWAGRNLAQYVIAGAVVGVVTRFGLTWRSR